MRHIAIVSGYPKDDAWGRNARAFFALVQFIADCFSNLG
jgi:hypothetical protein